MFFVKPIQDLYEIDVNCLEVFFIMDIRDWNKYQDYLLNTRKNFWNNDYPELFMKP